MPSQGETMGSAVRERRREAGLSLAGLADKSSISMGDVVDIEEGLRPATAKEVSDLARALDESPSHWLRKAGHISLSNAIPEPITYAEVARRRREYAEQKQQQADARQGGGEAAESRERDREVTRKLVRRAVEKLKKAKQSLLEVRPTAVARQLSLPRRIHHDPQGPEKQIAFAVTDDGCGPAFRRRDIVALEPCDEFGQGELVVAKFPGERWPLLRARVKVNGRLLYQATNPDWSGWYVNDSPEDPEVEVLGRVRSLIYRRV